MSSADEQPADTGDPRLGALCMLTLVALYTAIGRDWLAAVILAPAALLPALVRARVQLGAIAQGLLSFALLAAAMVLWQLLPGPAVPFRGAMGPLVPFLAMGSILLASHRLFLANPMGGDRATVAHGFWCLVACGSQRTWLPYVAGCALYLLLAGAWLRRGGRPWALGSHRRWWVGVMVLSAALAGILARVIPAAHARVVGWLIEDEPQIGLSDGPMELGSLSGLADSDRVVARAKGLPAGALLRAIVYQDYSRGRWLNRPSSFARSTAIRGGGGPVELRFEPSDVPRFLLPLDARSVALSNEQALVDPYGVVSPLLGAQPRWARFEAGPRDQYAPAPPDSFDLQVPSSIRAAMGEQARRLTDGAQTPEERLARIEQALRRDHPYSLEFQRKPGVDPVLAFLSEPGAAGHCEYFASASALLLRASGIPARLVSGYRATEYNQAGGYHVIRERNAHAWTEAYLEGKGWVTLDATPPGSADLAGPAITPSLSAWLDVLRERGADAAQAAIERPAPLAVGLLGVVVFIVARDVWRSRRARGTASDPLGAAPPPPHLQGLLRALERRGVVRPPSETLEATARRVEQMLPGDEAAALLRGYAALRYGGQGSEDELRQAIERYVAAHHEMTSR